ncbi:MAG: hypothetical protein JEY94_06170 [Melioribacteraceae bacterium]|nr:hypothetical protein [Melioribacteraceae bacterium]
MAFTFFFRDINTLENGVKQLLPNVVGKSKIKIWDAGCAMGPEPYSLAIILAEQMGKFAFKNVSITASDIDGSNLFDKIISDGVYSQTELGRIPKELFEKYFTKVNSDEDKYKIVDEIRLKLKFVKHDLLTLKPVDSNFNLIICKNVLLHFNYEERIEVIKMFHNSLDTNGVFATEQTQKIPQEIEHLFERLIPNGQVFKKVNV